MCVYYRLTLDVIMIKKPINIKTKPKPNQTSVNN